MNRRQESRGIMWLMTFLLMSVGMVGAATRDERVVEYRSPVRVLWTAGNITGEDELLQTGNGQAELTERVMCHMRNSETEQASVLLDFGEEIHGGLRIVTGMSAVRENRVRIRYGESVSEAMSDITPESGATNDHAMRDFTLALPWLGVANTGNSGFRFVRIDLLGEDSDLLLEEVNVAAVYRDIPVVGSFRCNDERLNRIWQTGAHTVHLCMQDFVWDGIKRDRLVWIGDMHPEVMTISCVFGNPEVVERSLDLVRDITPIPQWMNNHSSYSIWWLLIQRDWFLHHGNREYLMQQRNYIEALLHHLMSKVDEKGVEQLDGTRFLDWPSNANPEGIHAGLQALMVMAMDAGRELALEYGNAALASDCDDMAKKLRRNIPDVNGSKQAASLQALAGMTDAKKMDRKFISKGGAENFSTFYGYYMLEAMAMAGNYDGAMRIIRDYWGGMLDLGATTFWEDFDMKWMKNAGRIDEMPSAETVDVHASYGNYCYQKLRHSLCHGWASGPTAWMSRHVLGIKPIKPGCSVVSITPHLGNLEWAEGTFPTPYGLIRVRHEKKPDGTVSSVIDAPEEIDIVR